MGAQLRHEKIQGPHIDIDRVHTRLQLDLVDQMHVPADHQVLFNLQDVPDDVHVVIQVDPSLRLFSAPQALELQRATDQIAVDAMTSKAISAVVLLTAFPRECPGTEQVNRRRTVVEADHDRVRLHSAETRDTDQILDAIL